MTMTDTTARVVGRAALTAAIAGSVLAPIHALARFATVDGKEDLESAVVRAWAEPAARALRPLLDWADPQTVYVTYGKLWALIIAPAVLCAYAIWQRRGTVTGAEKWGWRMALVGYLLATCSVIGDYWTPWLDESFLFLGIPGVLVSISGSATLGIGLLRRRFRPAATGWLLALWLPLFLLLSSVIAMGAALLPMLWAWGLAGRQFTGRYDVPEPSAPAPAHS